MTDLKLRISPPVGEEGQSEFALQVNLNFKI